MSGADISDHTPSEIDRSHSRPRTYDDNPFSKAQFKAMNYRPDYADRFADINAA
jgi:putative transposase